MSRQPLLESKARAGEAQALATTVGFIDGLGDQPPVGELTQGRVHRLLRDAEGGEQLVHAEAGRLRDEIQDAVMNPRQAVLGEHGVRAGGDRAKCEMQSLERAIELAQAGRAPQ